MPFLKSPFKTRSKGPVDPKTYCLTCDPEKFKFCECSSDKQSDDTSSLNSELSAKADMADENEAAESLAYDDQFENFRVTLQNAENLATNESEQEKPVFTFQGATSAIDQEQKKRDTLTEQLTKLNFERKRAFRDKQVLEEQLEDLKERLCTENENLNETVRCQREEERRLHFLQSITIVCCCYNFFRKWFESTELMTASALPMPDATNRG